MNARTQRAATARITSMTRFHAWLAHNAGCLNESLQRFTKTPLANLLTIMVLGIALSLPGSLYMLTKNLLSLSGNWDKGTHITLYLNQDVGDAQAAELALSLEDPARYSSIQFLSRDQALAEFRRLTRFNEALDKLDKNPLPAVILLTPVDTLTAKQLQPLLGALQDRPEVELAQLDLQWIQRLQSILQIAQRALLVVFALLALAVILVVGNTIRLEIENRRDEIVITKLFGATHAFIRRPFLYDGLWFGLLGGLLSSLLIVIALWLLASPVARLIALYDSNFQPIYPDTLFILTMIVFGGLLGYAGAWLAVSQHLHQIEPA